MSDPLVLQVIKNFVGEARDLSEAITADLLALERSPAEEGPARRDAVARGLHTLKGSAATLGLGELATIAHEMEDALAPALKTDDAIERPLVDVLLGGLDGYLAALEALARQEPIPEEYVLAARGRIASYLAGSAPAVPASRLESGARPEPIGPSTDGSWRVDAAHVMGLAHEIERVRELRLRAEERRRVLEGAARQLARVGGAQREVALTVENVSRGLALDGEEAADVLAALEGRIAALSTVPLERTLEPLRRGARDLSQRYGKRIALSIVAAGVAVDRTIAEALRGPLVHLVRNAIVHGIETPDERARNGKHSEGVIAVRAESVGNLIVVEVSDDGRGIDPERVAEAAVTLGRVTPERLARMTADEVVGLVFEQGFSTAGKVDSDAGRGVGLDVVRSEVEARGGTVGIRNRVGQGVEFTLTLPLERGSTRVLLVRVAGQVFGISLMGVERGFALRLEDVVDTPSGPRVRDGSELRKFLDLGVLLRLRSSAATRRGAPVLVVSHRGTRLALSVDEVTGEADLVVRPLPHELRDLVMYQGVATLAMGELAPVLSPEWLVQSRYEAETIALKSTQRALVVDDSIAARAMYRAILEASGFMVHPAGSMREAREQLVRGRYDVIVLDVVLGDGSGIDLLVELRRGEDTRSTPVVLVSGQDTSDLRERGLKAGADAVLEKRECASGRLREEIAMAMARRGVAA